MIAKLEWTLSNAYQTKTQTQNPHKQWEVNETINQQQPRLSLRTVSSLSYREGVGLNAFYWRQIFALDSFVVKNV